MLWYCLGMCRSKVFPPFFESLYWGMLIYFLFWNLLDVVNFCLTSSVCWICCFRFCRFGHFCLRQWRERCVSGCCEQERVTHHNRWWVQFLHSVKISLVLVIIYNFDCFFHHTIRISAYLQVRISLRAPYIHVSVTTHFNKLEPDFHCSAVRKKASRQFRVVKNQAKFSKHKQRSVINFFAEREVQTMSHL